MYIHCRHLQELHSFQCLSLKMQDCSQDAFCLHYQYNLYVTNTPFIIRAEGYEGIFIVNKNNMFGFELVQLKCNVTYFV